MNTRYLLICLVPAAMLLAGCAAPENADVEGTVTLQKKPLANIKVIFMAEYEKGTKAPYTSAITDEQGKYRLKTNTKGKGREGAVAGYYRIIFSDIQASAGQKSRVPPRYEQANQTPYKDVEITTGSQTLDFDLSGK